METSYQTDNFGSKVQTAMPKRMVQTQAHQQAPWRIQTQRGVLVLVVAVLGGLILWVMASITVQAGTAGLEVQNLEFQLDEQQRAIAGLRTQIAEQTASVKMEKRADALGFKPVKPQDVTYIVVPGYTGRKPSIQAPPPGSAIQAPLLKHAYTESLWDWMLQGLSDIRDTTGGITP